MIGLIKSFWEFNVEIHQEARYDGMMVFMVLILWLVYALVGFGVYYMVDTVGVNPYRDTVQSVSRKYVAGHYIPVTTTVGKTTVTNQVWVDDAWYINIDGGSYRGIVACPVSEERYYQFVRGTFVNASLITGRISGDTYCKALYKF